MLGRPMPAKEATALLYGQLDTGDETARIKVLPSDLAEQAREEDEAAKSADEPAAVD